MFTQFSDKVSEDRVNVELRVTATFVYIMRKVGGYLKVESKRRRMVRKLGKGVKPALMRRTL